MAAADNWGDNINKKGFVSVQWCVVAGAGCIVYPLLCVPSVGSDVVRVTARAEAGC